MRVMIVDDSPALRKMLVEMFDMAGHSVVAEADCMKDALKAYKDFKPDLVTLDLSLPQEDGLAILQALRALNRAAKVLIISANTQKLIHAEHFSAGAAGVLAKPFAFNEFLAAVKRLDSSV